MYRARGNNSSKGAMGGEIELELLVASSVSAARLGNRAAYSRDSGYGTMVMVPKTSLLSLEAWLPTISVWMVAEAVALGST